jgi:formylglycine-generating enzyme
VKVSFQIVFLVLCFTLAGFVSHAAGPIGEMQPLGTFAIDRTEVTVGQFRRFTDATKTRTQAERTGGGLVYGAGWEQKPGWSWQAPFGKPASDSEPAVHITYDEAQSYCQWAGKRLPTDSEWVMAAYQENRATPATPFVKGQIYPYPTGASSEGANCLNDCGPTPVLDHAGVLEQGRGHAPVGTTKPGVNGLYDMGANVWEWIDTGAADSANKGTRGGSWWYGATQMRRNYDASKPRDMAVVYIGFRCVKDLR